MDIHFTKEQLDILKEIATVGAGNAATGISKMLNKKVGIKVPRVAIVKLEKVPEFLGGPELLVSCVFLQVTGDFSASVLMLFLRVEALRLADFISGKQMGYTVILDERVRSALQELGNITTGCCLTALSDFADMKFTCSVPGLATDMLQACLDEILAKIAIHVEEVVLFDTEFSLEKNVVRGHFLLMPEPEGLRKIIGKLRGHKFF